MGYTHYWRFFSFVPFEVALEECKKIVETVQREENILANGDGEVGSRPTIGKNLIQFNGIAPNEHETFHLQLPSTESFSFCKTARKPYDKVVVACLAVMQERCGSGVEVSSDGDETGWQEGLKLASRILGRKVSLPAGIRRR